jgi:Na+/H+ antiporter NhaD/arsenite permease-like protein
MPAPNGLSHDTIRLVICGVTYVLIAVQQIPGMRVSRPSAALFGAVAMVLFGGLPLGEAYAAIDLDVIVFLLGVLILSGYLELGGFFEWTAERVVERVHSPRALLAAVVALSGVLSAFFVNDTICLVVTPLLIVVLRSLRLNPMPFLLAIALSSNVGSAMAITGNPQNMLIGLASGIHFARFIGALALPALGAMAIVYVAIALAYRRDLEAPMSREVDLPPIEFDRPLVIRALAIFGGALVCWLIGLSLPLVAISAGALMIAVSRRDPAAAFARVEWELLLFFAALFVVMRGIRDVELVRILTTRAAARLHGNPWPDAGVVSGAMLVLSNLVSNVPAVILWLPAVRGLPHADFVWLVMAMSSAFAGNLTLLGSMASLIVAERARARGIRVTWLEFFRVGVPVTFLTLLWGIVALLFTWRPG